MRGGRAILCFAVACALPQPADAQTTNWFARAANAVREQLDTDRPRVLRRSIELENASLDTLRQRLSWIGVELPIELRGDVTASLAVEVDLAGLRNAESYRIRGSLSSNRLVAEGLELRNLSARAVYADGRLTLEQLAVTIPDPRPNAPAGRATGTATLQLLPAGALRATLQLADAPLEPFSRRVGAAEALEGGRLTGQVIVEAPVSTLRDVNAWRGTGQITLTELTAAGRSVERVIARAELAEGVLSVPDFNASIERERLIGSGTLGLTEPFDYQASLSMPEGRLERLEDLFHRNVPQNLTGLYELTARATGTLRPFVLDAKGWLAGNDWMIAEVPVSSFRAHVRSDGREIVLSRLDAQVRGGRLSGDGTLRLTDDTSFSFRLRPQRFDLAALDSVVSVALQEQQPQRMTVGYRALQAGEGPSVAGQRPAAPAPDLQLGGSTTGEIDVEGQRLPFRLDALKGTLTFENLSAAGATFDRAEVVADTQERTLVLSRLLLVRGEGRLTGEGRFGLDAPGAFSVAFRSEKLSIDAARPLFGETVPELRLPPVSGSLDGEVTAAGETQPFRLDSLQGRLAGDDIRIGGLAVDRFEIAAATADDAIDVSDLLVVIGDGRLTGQARFGLAGERPFEATLRPDRFRIELLRPLFGEDGVIETEFPPVSGRVSGEVTLRGRTEPEALDGVSGRISAEEVRVSGTGIDRAAFAIATEQGIAHVRDLRATSDFGTLTGTADVALAAPWSYTTRLAFDDFDLSAIGRLAAGITEEQRPDIVTPAEVAAGPGVLPIQLEGLADLTADLRGTLSPLVVAGEGTVGSEQLVLDARDLSEVFRPTTLSRPRFDWSYNERRLTLRDIRAAIGGGTIAGAAAVPLGDAAAGSLALRITDVELSDLLKLSSDLGGVASGGITADLGPADAQGVRAASGRADLSIPALRAGRIAAGNVTASITFDRDLLGYDVAGRLFDGTLAARGELPLHESAQSRASGSLQWQGANLDRITAAATAGDPLLSGRLDLSADYDLGEPGTKGSAAIQLTNVRTGDTLVTDQLQARAAWADSVIRVENAAGSFAGGTVSFAVALDADEPGRGNIEILLRRADAHRALGWIPGLEPLEGMLDAKVRGQLGALWRWTGEGEVTRGSYGPLAFSSWRVPIEIDANPLRGAILIELRRTSIRAAHGRGVLDLTYRAGASPRFDLDATFDDLEATRIVASDGLGRRLAGGRVSGSVQLASRNLRSLADLEGTVFATLRGARAQNLPVIGSVVEIARLPAGGGTIDEGQVRAYLRSGVVRVDEIALAGPSFRLFAEGTAALGSGRVALDVVVDNSPSRADRLLAAFLLRQFVDYGTPIGWIDRANRLIAERAIFLRVTGTYRRPVVRVRPVEQLGQEAVRFFLNELAGPAGSPRTAR